jgi:predicted dehydrogenase
MTPIGFGIVGCGMIAQVHARAIADLPNARLVALCSRSPTNAARVAHAVQASANSCAIYQDIHEMLRRPDLQVICICTPSGAHLEPAVAAAAAGKHVIVEKPLEIALDRCDQIIEACQHHQVQLGVIFPSRFADAIRELHHAIEAGRFGRITLGETACKWWRPQSYFDVGGWKGTRALDGGGALMNQAIHNVDLLLWLLGSVTHVAGFTATLAHERIEVEDTVVACLHFANGALGVIQAATSARPGWPRTVAVHGDHGSVLIEQEDILRWNFVAETEEDRRIKARFARRAGVPGGASDPAAISHRGHTRQLADFLHALETNNPPAVDGREGRKAVQVVLAIYEAASASKVVEVR